MHFFLSIPVSEAGRSSYLDGEPRQRSGGEEPFLNCFLSIPVSEPAARRLRPVREDPTAGAAFFPNSTAGAAFEPKSSVKSHGFRYFSNFNRRGGFFPNSTAGAAFEPKSSGKSHGVKRSSTPALQVLLSIFHGENSLPKSNCFLYEKIIRRFFRKRQKIRNILPPRKSKKVFYFLPIILYFVGFVCAHSCKSTQTTYGCHVS